MRSPTIDIGDGETLDSDPKLQMETLRIELRLFVILINIAFKGGAESTMEAGKRTREAGPKTLVLVRQARGGGTW